MAASPRLSQEAPLLEQRMQQLETQLLQRMQALEVRLTKLEAPVQAVPGRSGSRQHLAESQQSERGLSQREVAEEGEVSEAGSISTAFEDEEDEDEASDSESEHEPCLQKITGVPVLSPTYPFEESTWDAVLFPFLRGVGFAPSVAICVLLLINIFTQFSLVWVVGTYMVSDPLPEDLLFSLLRFRAGPAHHINYADAASGTSLLYQICSEPQRVPFAGTQAGLLGDISTMKDGGRYLCTLVMLSWFIMLMGEFDSAVRFAVAVISLAGGRRTVLRRQGEHWTVANISAYRAMGVILFSVLPRLLLVIYLLFVGSKLLVVTTSMTDLLLNSLGLAFVIDVDNMLYSSFAPNRFKVLIPQLAPVVYRKRSKTIVNVALSSFVKVTTVFIVIVVAYHLAIGPFYWRMDQAYNTLCSGNSDFVFAVNTATQQIEVAESFDSIGSTWTHNELAVLNLAQPAITSGPGFQLPDKVARALRISTLKTAEWQLRINETDLNLEYPCADVNETRIRRITRVAGGCHETQDRCPLLEHTAIRALCPVTCGCRTIADPEAGFLAGPGFGCPSRCSFGIRAELQQDATLQCLDSQPSLFGTDAGLKLYFQTAMRFFNSRSEYLMTLSKAISEEGKTVGLEADSAASVLKKMREGRFLRNILDGHWDLTPGIPHPRGLQGCAFWTSWEVMWLLNIDFCAVDRWRSLRPYCPVACNCRQGMDQCPLSCKRA